MTVDGQSRMGRLERVESQRKSVRGRSDRGRDRDGSSEPDEAEERGRGGEEKEPGQMGVRGS